MAQDVVSGSRATAGATAGILSNVRVIDMSDTIHLLDPNEAPLTAISMKLNKVSCVNPKFEWLEDDYLPNTGQIDGDTGTIDALDSQTFDVHSGEGARFRAGDVLKALDTGEVMYVTAVSSDTLTVTRGIGDTAVGDLADNADLLIIGNANAENSTKRTIKTTKKSPLFNYTQIFRWEFGASRTLQMSELYGGSDMSYQQRKAGKEFRIQMERSCLFGEKEEILTGDTALRFTDGIINRISTNVTTDGTIDADDLEDFLRDGFRYGPARKMLFASRKIVSFITNIARGSLQTFVSDSSFPLAIVEYVSPHGKLYICTHNLLTGDHLNDDAYEGWALLLDLDSIFYRPLRGSDTKLRTNIQANDADGRIDGYLAEAGFMVIQEQNHSILKGVDTYA